MAELFRDVAEKIGERPGGYTRILKTGNRLGDNAEMCIIELVDYNENLLSAKEDKPKKRRSRRGGAKTKETTVTPAPGKVEKVVEETNAEEVVAEPNKEEAAATEVKTEEPVQDETKADDEEKKAQ